jgi:hypothetical protein
MPSEAEIRYAFEVFDKDGSGTLSRDELMEIFTAMGPDALTEEQAEQMITSFDVNGDGELSLDEFSTALAAFQGGPGSGVASGGAPASSAPYPKAKDGTPIGIECTDDTLAQLGAWVEESAFAKTACVKAACQNYAFTCEQAAAFLTQVNFDDDRMEMLEAFRDRLTDPDESAPILSLFSEDEEDEDRQAAGALIGEFTAAETREIEEIAVEDDGQRTEEGMEALLAALEDASFSDDKLDVLREDVAAEPSPPPFSAAELGRVLELFPHSDDREAALDFFAGPKLVYPMTCEEMICVLDAFSFSDDKKSVLAKLKPYIKDAQNKLSLVVHFSHSDDQEEAELILRDALVQFEPEEPPEEAIQEALRVIGTCPAGYDWVKQPSGYRCRAGGHYCSNERIQEYLDSQ